MVEVSKLLEWSRIRVDSSLTIKGINCFVKFVITNYCVQMSHVKHV